MGEENGLGLAVAPFSGRLQMVSNTQLDRIGAVPVYFTISLISLSIPMPLPASRTLKISVFHLILGCASMLSSTLPTKLIWLPYLACIRPLFHILPYPFQRRILHFSEHVWDIADQRMPAPIRRLSAAIRRLAAEDASPDASPPFASSSSQQARLNLEGVSVEEVTPDASASSHSYPTSIYEGFDALLYKDGVKEVTPCSESGEVEEYKE